MDDAKTIQEAYNESVAGLFSFLVESLRRADNDAAAEAKAEKAFKGGLALARRARDRAIELVK